LHITFLNCISGHRFGLVILKRQSLQNDTQHAVPKNMLMVGNFHLFRQSILVAQTKARGGMSHMLKAL